MYNLLYLIMFLLSKGFICCFFCFLPKQNYFVSNMFTVSVYQKYCISFVNPTVNFLAWALSYHNLMYILRIHRIKSCYSFSSRFPPWQSLLKCSPCQIRTKRLAAWILNKQEKALCALMASLWFVFLILNSWAIAVFLAT